MKWEKSDSVGQGRGWRLRSMEGSGPPLAHPTEGRWQKKKSFIPSRRKRTGSGIEVVGRSSWDAARAPAGRGWGGGGVRGQRPRRGGSLNAFADAQETKVLTERDGGAGKWDRAINMARDESEALESRPRMTCRPGECEIFRFLNRRAGGSILVRVLSALRLAHTRQGSV